MLPQIILGKFEYDEEIYDMVIRNRCKMMTQIQDSKWQTLQLTSDYKGSDFTASVTLGNPDFLSGTGMGIAHYIQNVTNKLALGAELAYQASPQIPGMVLNELFWKL